MAAQAAGQNLKYLIAKAILFAADAPAESDVANPVLDGSALDVRRTTGKLLLVSGIGNVGGTALVFGASGHLFALNLFARIVDNRVGTNFLPVLCHRPSASLVAAKAPGRPSRCRHT
jgi:hypothetical protein